MELSFDNELIVQAQQGNTGASNSLFTARRLAGFIYGSKICQPARRQGRVSGSISSVYRALPRPEFQSLFNWLTGIVKSRRLTHQQQRKELTFR
jgi:hypothetical protein